MTTDKANLKALAEAANAVTTDVNITMAAGADPSEVKAVQDYLQLAMPKTILAVLAEIERLEASDSESTELCDCLSSLLGQVAVTVRGPEEPKSRHGFSDIPSRVKAVVAERDQLKAENEALRKDAERYQFIKELPNSTPEHLLDTAMAAACATDRRDNQNLTHQASNHSVD